MLQRRLPSPCSLLQPPPPLLPMLHLPPPPPLSLLWAPPLELATLSQLLLRSLMIDPHRQRSAARPPPQLLAPRLVSLARRTHILIARGKTRKKSSLQSPSSAPTTVSSYHRTSVWTRAIRRLYRSPSKPLSPPRPKDLLLRMHPWLARRGQLLSFLP